MNKRCQKVHGDRICQSCRGLCHEDAWRDNLGARKNYWCSEACLKADWNGSSVDLATWENFRDRNFEQVNVTSK